MRATPMRIAIILSAFVIVSAQAQTAKVVGLGASTCQRFLDEARGNPALERDYFAWAQGFMSGALMRAPQGVDEDLDLLPTAFPLQEQAQWLRDYCREHPDQDYMDAGRALYHRLQEFIPH